MRNLYHRVVSWFTRNAQDDKLSFQNNPNPLWRDPPQWL